MQPYVVPFLVRDYGFTESQRAMMLSAFTPGCALPRASSSFLFVCLLVGTSSPNALSPARHANDDPGRRTGTNDRR